MNERRKIIILIGMGGLIFLGMFLNVGLRRGANLRDQKNSTLSSWPKYSIENKEVEKLPETKPLIQIIHTDLSSLTKNIVRNKYISTLLCLLKPDDKNSISDFQQLHKMKIFYAHYKVNIEFIFLNPSQESKKRPIDDFFVLLNFIPDYPIFSLSQESSHYLKSLDPKAFNLSPVFFILNHQGEIKDHWSGSTSSQAIDSRFRRFFSH